jgi:hypothetical protein
MMRETHRLDPFEAHHGHGPSTRGRRPFRDRIVARSRTC